MTINELKLRLQNEFPIDYNVDSYNEGNKIGYNIENNISFWTFYFCDEKGNISDKKVLKTENEICEYVYNYMKKKYESFTNYLNNRKIEHKRKILETPDVIFLGCNSSSHIDNDK